MAVTRAAHQRGWPAPEIYAGDDPVYDTDPAAALYALDCAVASGRHDAVLMAVPPDPEPLLRLLGRCTRNGVQVTFVPSLEHAGPGLQMPVLPGPAAAGSGCLQATENGFVLAQAQLEALSGLFSAWQVWVDQHGWHARRRADGYVEQYRTGSPAFHVRATSAVELAAQLCWQDAADEHAPDGCQATTSRGQLSLAAT